jgi:hypothetical protein
VGKGRTMLTFACALTFAFGLLASGPGRETSPLMKPGPAKASAAADSVESPPGSADQSLDLHERIKRLVEELLPTELEEVRDALIHGPLFIDLPTTNAACPDTTGIQWK